MAVMIPIQSSLDQLQLAAQAVIDGLEAPDNGSQRMEAMNGWSDAVDSFEVAASPPETTTTTTPLTTTATTPIQEVDNAAPDAAEGTPPANDPTEAQSDTWVGVTLLIAILAYALRRRRRRSRD